MASPSHRPRWAEQGARPGALLTTCSHPTLRPWSLSGGELVPRQADLPALGALTAPGLVGAGSPAGEAGCGPHQPPPLPGSPMAATCEISNVFSNYFSTMYAQTTPLLPLCPLRPPLGPMTWCWPWAARRWPWRAQVGLRRGWAFGARAWDREGSGRGRAGVLGLGGTCLGAC